MWEKVWFQYEVCKQIYHTRQDIKLLPYSLTTHNKQNYLAFAALKLDGTVAAWGMRDGGGDCSLEQG